MNGLLSSSIDLVVGFQSSQQPVAGLLGVSEQHGCVLVEKDWVVHSSVADTKRPLHNHDLVRLPHPEQIKELSLFYTQALGLSCAHVSFTNKVLLKCQNLKC